MRNVTIRQKDGSPPLEFNADGSKKAVELKIVNLQHDGNGEEGMVNWEEIGVWQSWGKDKVKSEESKEEKEENLRSGGVLDIKDIVWPGKALKPPEGLPEKRFIRVSFLEEDPYVMLSPPSTCSSNKGKIINSFGNSDWLVTWCSEF